MEEDDFELVYREIGRLEEEGVIMERNKVYSVTKSQIPDSVMEDRFIMDSQRIRMREKKRRKIEMKKKKDGKKWLKRIKMRKKSISMDYSMMLHRWYDTPSKAIKLIISIYRYLNV